MKAENLEIYIFSFNRGPFLRNCLDSIRRFAPACPVAVVDDDSTDGKTREILAHLRTEIPVIQPNLRKENRHGGLYANMQTALNKATPGRKILFIQDDMMLVRSVRDADIDYIDAFFTQFPRAAFLNPVFLKGKRRKRDYRITQLQESFPVYFRHYPDKKNHRGISYADAVIADVDRLRSVNWTFSGGEVGNAEAAFSHFGKMGFMVHPFIMFLPQVTVYRGGRKTLGVRMAERRTGVNPKAFRELPEAEWKALFDRDLSILPHAERYLECLDSSVKKPFVYSAVNACPLPYCLHKAELFLRRG